ncbi:RrF2 family transcriptional regulator [Novosphingobium naphthalenivorans]|uniref:RrF2 family transcriptional regulator n=1 Tax=Novosphingobium naphthalenivorans TaxID=273168 RepID=UPI000831FF02|nr:Rrf2 family transcriptional regulator [Novosphingobium naphthalenivorans]
MQLSESVEWGLHACLALAMMPDGARVPARALAEYHGIKPSYFSKVMQRLVAAGIVQSVEGRSGGLAMAQSAEDVSLLQIVMAIEDHQAFFRCTEIRQKGPCAAASKHYRAPCTIAKIMHQADAEWRRVLAGTSLADLRRSAITQPVPGVHEATQAWLTETGAVRGI